MPYHFTVGNPAQFFHCKSPGPRGAFIFRRHRQCHEIISGTNCSKKKHPQKLDNANWGKCALLFPSLKLRIEYMETWIDLLGRHGFDSAAIETETTTRWMVKQREPGETVNFADRST